MSYIYQYIVAAQEFFKDYRWFVIVMALSLLSFLFAVLGRYIAMIRLRVRLMGLWSIGRFFAGDFVTLPTGKADNIAMILATSLSEGKGINATGHGQVRGAFELSNAIHKAYGYLNPTEIKLSKDEEVAGMIGSNSLFIIGGPTHNDYLKKFFADIAIQLEQTWGDKIELADNAITLKKLSKEPVTFVPIKTGNEISEVFGVIARTKMRASENRVVVAAGTKTQGTQAACQYLCRKLPVYQSLCNRDFVAIVRATVQGSSIEPEIQQVYFRGLKKGIGRRLSEWWKSL